MEINNKNLRLTIWGCFRYSLGRMTYMPSHVFDMVKNCQEIFRPYDWNKMIEEIDECENLGMECDKKKWLELKQFAIKKYQEVN